MLEHKPLSRGALRSPRRIVVIGNYWFWLLIVAAPIWHVAAAPSVRHLEESTHPLIVKARSYDFLFGRVGSDSNRDRAEELYNRFIEENPESELVPVVYDHLGQLYSGPSRPADVERTRAIPNKVKAYQYYRKAVESHPKEKVSGFLLDTWVCAAAVAPTEKQRIDEYLEYYRWLVSLNDKNVKNSLWLASDEVDQVRETPELADRMTFSILRNRDQMKEVVQANVVAIAAGSDSNPLELLKVIEESKIEPEIEKAAIQAQEKLIEENPLLQAESTWWQWVAWVLGSVLGIACVVVAIVLMRRRRATV